MRERDIRNAIVAALEATNAFDGIFLWGFRDASEHGSELTRAAAILAVGGEESDLFDDVAGGQAFEDDTCQIVIMARDGDEQARDESADRLLNVAKDALNGNALNVVLGSAALYPQWTKIRRWRWKDPVPPQREIECVFTYRFDAPTWVTFDTSE